MSRQLLAWVAMAAWLVGCASSETSSPQSAAGVSPSEAGRGASQATGGGPMSGGPATNPATGGGPIGGNGPGVTPVDPIPTTLEPGSCGLEQPAFRETFDTPLSGVTAAISVRPQMELPALWAPGGASFFLRQPSRKTSWTRGVAGAP